MTYVPTWLRQPNAEYAIQVAKQIGFATVMQPSETHLLISHLPVHVANDNGDSSVTVRFHVASGNQFAERLTDGSKVVVIFRGPDGYISSRWYDHENVPTWNYVAVHMQGTVTPMAEADLRLHILELVADFDPGLQIRDAYIDEYLPWIKGFSVLNPTIEPVFKLGQDKNEA